MTHPSEFWYRVRRPFASILLRSGEFFHRLGAMLYRVGRTAHRPHQKKVIGFDVWNTTALIRAWPVEPLLDVGKAMNIPLDSDAALKSRFVDFCNSTSVAEPAALVNLLADQFSGKASDDAVLKVKEIIRVENAGFAWYKDVLPVFNQLKKVGIGIGLLSDTWMATADKLRGPSGAIASDADACAAEAAELNKGLLSVSELVDHVVLSCEVNMTKPNKRIFEEFASRFGVRCEDCVYVGDNIMKDIHGARNAGMTAILLDRTGAVSAQEKADLHAIGVHCVGSLYELLQLLRVLGFLPERA